MRRGWMVVRGKFLESHPGNRRPQRACVSWFWGYRADEGGDRFAEMPRSAPILPSKGLDCDSERVIGVFPDPRYSFCLLVCHSRPPQVILMIIRDITSSQIPSLVHFISDWPGLYARILSPGKGGRAGLEDMQ